MSDLSIRYRLRLCPAGVPCDDAVVETGALPRIGETIVTPDAMSERLWLFDEDLYGGRRYTVTDVEHNLDGRILVVAREGRGCR